MSETALVVDEQQDLARCEKVIKEGMATFVEVGQALARIRDGRLYRETHKSFSAYVGERWDKTRQWADHTIKSAGVAERIESDKHVCQKPNQRQAAEIAKAPPEEQAEVWEEAIEEHGESVTAADVAEVVERRRPAPTPAPKPPKNGSPTLSRQDREYVEKRANEIVKRLSAKPCYERFRPHINGLLTEAGRA